MSKPNSLKIVDKSTAEAIFAENTHEFLQIFDVKQMHNSIARSNSSDVV